MSRAARLWKGAGALALTGLCWNGVNADELPSSTLSRQLVNLARQAEAQGQAAQAGTFFEKALELDPSNADARSGLKLVAFRQEGDIVGGQPFSILPTDPGPVVADDHGPMLDRMSQMEQIAEQRLTSDIRSRLGAARDFLRQENSSAALDQIRLAITALEAEDKVSEETIRGLRQQLEAEYRSALRREEEIDRALYQRRNLAASASQEQRALDALLTTQQTISSLMLQFDTLLNQGIFNVLDKRGTGDIVANSKPFFDARILAQTANALDPGAVAPRAGLFVSSSIGFLAQTRAYEELKEFRYMATMLDVDRASVPFPDTITIEYPPADVFREISEKRIARYESVDLVERSDQTLRILSKLEEPISMPFGNETPLSDVLEYIQQVTADENMPAGIPIYVDPVGLLEADRTPQSPVTIELDGVPLKNTLRLMLRQLDLTSTVQDGLLTITSAAGSDTPTEIRVYPVADLSIIPISLYGGGGGGGMGGGMGGMGGGGMGGMGGGGMGGMGGGGMGGGMGGMGGGGMGGGMFSLAPVTLQEPATSPFLEKKDS